MTTFDKIKYIIAEALNIDSDSVTESLSIGDVPQWDSMGNMAVISAIEQKLGIEFPIEDLFELNSVEALVKEIDKIL